MKAIVVEDGSLVLADQRDLPPPGPEEVLIDVVATAVNRADLLQARGKYPPPAGASTILGLECTGIIRACGSAVQQWKPGDACMALLPGGAYAEQVIAHGGSLMPIPAGCDLADAAAIPEVFLTVFLNCFHIAGVQSADRVLVHAGASGIGTAAIQMLKMIGANVVVTVGSDAKAAACRQLGADSAINYKQQDFCDVLKQQDQRCDIILDCVGADYFQKNCSLLASDGRLIMIGCMSGSQSEISLAQLISKRLRIIGSTLRARSPSFKSEIISQFKRQFFASFEDRTIGPIIHKRFDLADAEQAHAYLRSSQHVGKLLLQVR